MELGPIFLISRNKKILLITIVVLFVIFGLIITNGRGDLVSPSIAVGGTSIELPFTDDNTGETLIIHSNKETYGGWDNATVYFSIKNTTRNEQLISSKFLFSTQNESLEKVEVFNDGLWQELNFKEVEISVPDSISTKPIPDEFSGDKQFSQLIRGKETKYFRATLSFPPKSGIKKFYLESFGDGGAYGLLDPWYNNNYTYRRKITINNSQVATTTGNMKFTIVATTTLASLKTTGNGGNVGESNGYDIVWVDDDDTTLLDYEVEEYDATTGKIIHWIETDLSSSKNKIIYMYYGNASATDVSDKEGTWDTNFKGVYHLEESPSNGGTHDDSTSNNHDLTVNAFTTSGSSAGSTDATGYIGGADLFDGSDDYLTDEVANTTTSFTVSYWLNYDSGGNNWPSIFSSARGALYVGAFSMKVVNETNDTCTPGNKISWEWFKNLNKPGSTNCIGTSSDDVWHNIVLTYDSVAESAVSYYDGVANAATSTPSFTGLFDDYEFGRAPIFLFHPGPFTLDEAKISYIARHSSDIATRYNTESCVSCFMTIADEEVLLQGTVYTDEGTTNIGSGKTVAISIDGGATATTTETDASGNYEIGATIASGETVLVWLDDEAENGATVTVTSTAMTGLDIYQNRLIVRNDNNSGTPVAEMTNALLNTADNGDSDIDAIYDASSGLTLNNTAELFIPTGHIFQPGGAVTANEVDNNGTLILERNNATVLGNWDATGGTTFTTSTVTFATTTATQTIIQGGNTNPFYNLTFNGSGGTFQPLDQLNASSTISITAGVLTPNGNNIFIDDAWSNSSTFTAGTSTVSFTTSTAVTVNITAGGSPFNSLTFNDSGGGAIFELQDQLQASSTITITAGTLDANGQTILADANFTVTDTFSHSSGVLNFASSTATSILTASTSPVYDLTHSGAGILTLSDAVTIANDLTNSAGTLDIDGLTTITGDITNSATITEDGSYIAKAAASLTLDNTAYDTLSGNTSMTITLVDQDENLDGTSDDSSLGTSVTLTTGSDSEAVTLTESGNATETFTANIIISRSFGAGAINDGTLNVLVDDTITVTYTDDEDAADGAATDTATVTTSSSSSGTTTGGGGGGPIATPPSESKVVINNEDAYTNTHEVLLTLFSINASSMAMSNRPDFSGASFIPYSTSESFQLSSGEGKKTVYVKFRTDSGGEKTVSDTITIDTVAPTAPRITNPLEVASIYETNPIITGTAEPNTILQLTIDQRPSISLTVPDSGEWSYLPQSPLSLGIHSIKAVNIIDGALNVSPEKLRTFSVVSDVVIPVPGIPEPPKPPVIPTPDEPVEPTTPDEPVEPDEPIAIDKPSLPKAPALSIIDRAIIYIGRVVREISDNAHDVNIIDRTLIAIGNSANTIIDSVPKVEINVFDRTLALFRNATDTFIKTVVRGVPTFPENPVTRSLAYLSSKTDTFDALLSRVNNPFIPDAPKERIVKDVVLPPVVSEKIETVVPEDLVTGKLSFFHPYGNLEIPVSEVDERVEVLTGQRLTLFFKPEREVNTISASLILQTSISLGPQELRFLFIKPANAITVASAKDYLMYETEFTDKDGDGVYEALLYAPVVSGGYILKTEIDYVEGEDEVIEKEFLIDPEGYVFESSRKGQVRLEDSAVTIYYLDPSSNTFVVWDAGLYYQINPHITDNTGQYSFLVPEGTYQLTVTKNGYTSYNGEAFEVKRTAPVHQNIELLPKNIFQTLKSLFLRSD